MPLLPSGLQDILPPYAARERRVMGALLDRFALFGYEQVTPPLLEFESTLFAGKGNAYAHNTFRVMDTESQRMLGLRADITPQIERIATSLLKGNHDVVRLCYVGQVLRVAPTGLSPLRQLRQAGMEMIGARAQVSELEVLSAALEALQTLQLSSLALSLSVAGLFDVLFAGCLPEAQAAVRKAIHHKDTGSLPLAMPSKALTMALMSEPLTAVLARHDIPSSALTMLQSISTLHAQLQERFPTLTIHADPLDTEGFDYHTGACFTLYDTATRQEIGRGGCYDLSEAHRGCGLTFYIERLVLSAIAEEPPKAPHAITEHTPYLEAKTLRDQGIITLLRPSHESH